MAFQHVLCQLGDAIVDPDEEVFVLFSNVASSRGLGMLDSKAKKLNITVAGRDLEINQSPGILTSNRSGGTTGAVVWAITPLFAEWVAAPSNVLVQWGVLSPESIVLELGCGVSGIVGLTLSPKVARYILTDQDYVMKLLKQNVEENVGSSSASQQSHRKSKPQRRNPSVRGPEIMILDWESSSLRDLPHLLQGTENPKDAKVATSLDFIIACDCVFNEALIDPFVQTCATLCKLRNQSAEDGGYPTLCVVAQQLRSPEVFEAWLRAMTRQFWVWRVPRSKLSQELAETSGFVVHWGILKDQQH